ncbi:hypothetical protein DERP_008687 [Dermatophagoides pteronyssinus]|uniref:Transmembrane protein n=1 Tax=Dermatophagoides pteronyssinus TaxID=6956 RepID=A0ABQ8IWC2_DERPT|nr:hypothetical protein DERP_008687 [Dermatophagoides pteronyssinus]
MKWITHTTIITPCIILIRISLRIGVVVVELVFDVHVDDDDDDDDIDVVDGDDCCLDVNDVVFDDDCDPEEFVVTPNAANNEFGFGIFVLRGIIVVGVVDERCCCCC